MPMATHGTESIAATSRGAWAVGGGEGDDELGLDLLPLEILLRR